MHLVVLANATDDAARTEYEERQRFAALTAALNSRGVQVQAAWNLLGRYDYLLILEVGGEVEDAFAALSLIAQSGTMRTESMAAIPLERYFELAARVATSDATEAAVQTAHSQVSG